MKHSIKKILLGIIACAGITGLANAATPGGYAGLGLGYGKLIDDKTDKKSSSGLAGRLFAGYNFNQYFGLEIGYDKFKNTKGNDSNTIETKKTLTYPTVTNTTIKYPVPVLRKPYPSKTQYNEINVPTIKMNTVTLTGTQLTTNKYQTSFSTVDLVGKAYLPLSESGFNVYVLGGVAYAMSEITTKTSVVDSISNTEVKSTSKKTERKFLPKYGAGVSYDIPNTSLTTNLELSRVEGSGSIPSANEATINLAYNFG